MFESYSDYKLSHRFVVKRTSLQPKCSLNEMVQLWIFDKNFFFPNLELLDLGAGYLRGQLIRRCLWYFL